MSSWLSISLPNPFKSPEEDQSSPSPLHHPAPPSPAVVTQDLSELTQSIGRQLRGVAAFLAPPPTPPPPLSSSDSDDATPTFSTQAFTGIKNDLVEIGGSFKSSLSLLSSNNAVSGISRFASNLLQFENDKDVVEAEEEEEGFEEPVGITEEVVNFVREISLRPECWTDFPLTIDEDFDMSEIQKDHVATIEQLVPSVGALRHKIKSYLSEQQFWMIYFILLLPRLNEEDYELLLNPEIVEVRDALLQKLKSKKNATVEISEETETGSSSQQVSVVNITQGMKNLSQIKDLPPEKVSKSTPKRETQDHENSELWFEDDDTYTSDDAHKQAEDEDGVSFSDLEDDDNDLSSRLSGVRLAQSNKASSQCESNNWVRLDENLGTMGGQQEVGRSISRERHSEGEESYDWLTVDDIDSES